VFNSPFRIPRMWWGRRWEDGYQSVVRVDCSTRYFGRKNCLISSNIHTYENLSITDFENPT
jgi:hypothetical protein